MKKMRFICSLNKDWFYSACTLPVHCLYPRGYGKHIGIGPTQRNQSRIKYLLFHTQNP